MATQCVLQLLQKGDISGFTRSKTLLILREQTHSVDVKLKYMLKSVTLPTRMEMMPLCFSSIRSQMILLSKYCTVSHLNWRRTFGEQCSVSSDILIKTWNESNWLLSQRETHCNSLSLVLLLLGPQSELNEQLLELLVAVVDTELFKTLGTRKKTRSNQARVRLSECCVQYRLWWVDWWDHTCCAVGPQSHRCPEGQWLRSLCCCGRFHPAKVASFKLVIHSAVQTHEGIFMTPLSTFRASDWFIFCTIHVKVRPYIDLAKASRAATACSKFKGLIIWNANTHVDTKLLRDTWHNKQQNAWGTRTLRSLPLLLWQWVSCEWVPPRGLSYQHPAAAKQQHICAQSASFVHIWTSKSTNGTVLTFARWSRRGSLVM